MTAAVIPFPTKLIADPLTPSRVWSEIADGTIKLVISFDDGSQAVAIMQPNEACTLAWWLTQDATSLRLQRGEYDDAF